jgi:hypothetical protein
MTMKRLGAITLALTALAFALPGVASGDGASPGLGGLETLVGEWTISGPDGKTSRASYDLASAGSALVERVDTAEGPSMVTVYHRDGDGLALTHYCALGNQPRMKARMGDGKVFDFAFVDASNLASQDAPHMHSLKLTLVDKDHFSQDWTLHQGGKQEMHTFRYERVK